MLRVQGDGRGRARAPSRFVLDAASDDDEAASQRSGTPAPLTQEDDGESVGASPGASPGTSPLASQDDGGGAPERAASPAALPGRARPAEDGVQDYVAHLGRLASAATALEVRIQTGARGAALADEEIGPVPQETRDELLEYVDVEFGALLQYWLDPETIPQTAPDAAATAWRRLGLPLVGRLHATDIEGRHREIVVHILRVQRAMCDLGLFETETMENVKMTEDFNRALAAANVAAKLCKATLLARDIFDPAVSFVDACAGQPLAADLGIPLQPEEQTPFQHLLKYLLDALHAHGYRRHREACWRQIMTPENRLSHAWEHAIGIKEFVYKMCGSMRNRAQWHNLTSGQNHARMAEEHLKNCDELQFPELRPDRSAFSFRNGVYLMNDQAFVRYDELSLTTSFVSTKYFDLAFDERVMDEPDFMQIPTPHFDLIFDNQMLPDDARAWIYALLGRLLYALNTHDHWSIILFFKGVTGSGKSTVGQFMMSLFNKQDVEILSSNIEPQFGLESLVDALLWVCLEVQENFRLAQSDFNSIVSGEEVKVARKHKTAITRKWTAPGIMMGNVSANWKEAGSAGRRVALVEMRNSVMARDPHLKEKIEFETPHLIHKLNAMYRKYAEAYGKYDFWDVAPAYFHDTKKHFMAINSPMAAFLQESLDVYVAAGTHMPEHAFKDLFKAYLEQQGQPGVRWNPDVFQIVFNSNGIQIAVNVTLPVCDPVTGIVSDVQGNFLLGVCRRADWPMFQRAQREAEQARAATEDLVRQRLALGGTLGRVSDDEDDEGAPPRRRPAPAAAPAGHRDRRRRLDVDDAEALLALAGPSRPPPAPAPAPAAEDDMDADL